MFKKSIKEIVARWDDRVNGPITEYNIDLIEKYFSEYCTSYERLLKICELLKNCTLTRTTTAEVASYCLRKNKFEFQDYLNDTRTRVIMGLETHINPRFRYLDILDITKLTNETVVAIIEYDPSVPIQQQLEEYLTKDKMFSAGAEYCAFMKYMHIDSLKYIIVKIDGNVKYCANKIEVWKECRTDSNVEELILDIKVERDGQLISKIQEEYNRFIDVFQEYIPEPETPDDPTDPDEPVDPDEPSPVDPPVEIEVSPVTNFQVQGKDSSVEISFVASVDTQSAVIELLHDGQVVSGATCYDHPSYVVTLDNLSNGVEYEVKVKAFKIVDEVTYYSEEVVATALPKIVYGFHIDQSNPNPDECVTYLEDAVGMTPAYYDTVAGKVNLSDWKNRSEFLTTRDCMLGYDGEVKYYLDPDDETKKLDGTPSDVANPDFPGNAMVEWGINGKRIWYKFIKDTDGNGVSVYFSDIQLDENYVAWNFYNANNELMEHFYTPKYSAVMINGVLRSLSGFTPVNNISGVDELEGALKNNELGNFENDRWNTTTFGDYILEWALLVLFGKTLNIQSVFGQGYAHSHTTGVIENGTADGTGSFSGDAAGENVCKVFGMENTYGNQFRRVVGLVTNSSLTQLVKLTPGTADGSTSDSYNVEGDGYLEGFTIESAILGDHFGIKTLEFNEKGFYTISDVIDPADASKYYCTNTYIDSGRYAYIGGHYASGNTPNPMYIFLSSRITSKHDYIGTSISFR